MGHFINNSRLWLSKKTTDNQYKTAKLSFSSHVAIWKKNPYLKMQSPKALQNAAKLWQNEWKNEHKHDCCTLRRNKKCCKTFSDVLIYFEVQIQSFWYQCKVIMELADMATLTPPPLSLSHRCLGWVLCGVGVAKSSLLGPLLLNWGLDGKHFSF